MNAPVRLQTTRTLALPPPPSPRLASVPTAPARADAFERSSNPTQLGSPSSQAVPTDPSLAAELRSRRSAEVLRPIVGQATGRGGAAGHTMRGTLPDELNRRAGQAPTRMDLTDMDPRGADTALVREGLTAARGEMRPGHYAEAETRLRDLRENHSIGYLANGRLGVEGMNAAETMERQAGFCARMETRLGHTVACPPSEADSTAYFASFNNARERPQAQTEFSDYTRAFYTHTQTALSSTSDVVYSRDSAVTLSDGSRVQTSTPDSWRDVTSARQTAGIDAGTGPQTGTHAGRRVIDCEGYAYLSERLMGSAGYEVTHVTAGDRGLGRAVNPADLHAMTSVRDPSSGASVTQSNGAFYASDYDAYRPIIAGRGLSASPEFFRAPTMQGSQTRAME